MTGGIPILMPTAPRYLALAQWTCGQIARFWPGHPEIIICGAEGDPRCLPLQDDPADWMRIVARACEDLISRGIKQTFVILDDHPPIACCNDLFLSIELPKVAIELSATSIVATGFGPLVDKKDGEMKKRGGMAYERLALSEPWKLPLHPALWDVERLYGILQNLLVRLPKEQHTAWAFERIGSNHREGGVKEAWLSACWRPDAIRSADTKARHLHSANDRLQRAVFSGLSLVESLIKGGQWGFSCRCRSLLHPRIGAYPCFWSGVMKKGKINADYLVYAGIKKRTELTNGLEEAFSQCRS